MPRPRPDVRSVTRELLDPDEVLKEIKKRRGQGGLKKLAAEGSKRGYKPVDSADEVLGYRQIFEATREQRPRLIDRRRQPDLSDEAVSKVEFEFLAQSARKQRARGEAAIAVATISAGKNKDEYEMLLEAPDGDFARFTELTIDETGKVVEADSWWTAFTGCLPQCGGPCLTALAECRGTWIEYIGCVLWRCVGCGVKCAGCATCSCSWWCSWAVGCCRQ
jgi:hypothetical protein